MREGVDAEDDAVDGDGEDDEAEGRAHRARTARGGVTTRTTPITT
jgi:hypothetical protein